jgi:hypothetical protein
MGYGNMGVWEYGVWEYGVWGMGMWGIGYGNMGYGNMGYRYGNMGHGVWRMRYWTQSFRPRGGWSVSGAEHRKLGVENHAFRGHTTPSRILDKSRGPEARVQPDPALLPASPANGRVQFWHFVDFVDGRRDPKPKTINLILILMANRSQSSFGIPWTARDGGQGFDRNHPFGTARDISVKSCRIAGRVFSAED